jgi:transmembrane sensor
VRRVSTDLETDARLEAAGAWCLKLADGTLEPAERACFQAWLEAAPENRRALEDAVGIWRAVGDTSITPELLALRRDALTGFGDADRARLQGPRRREARRWKSALAAAACLVLTVGGAWTAYVAFAPLDYRTGVGERRVAVLSDGSRLSLDAETEVKVRYSRGARRLWLERGRAKFDVAKDPRRPFTVAAADKLVRATGTAFSVELVQKQVQVLLYEGHVAVFSEASGASALPLRLETPNALTNTPTSAPVDADAVLTPGRELVASVGSDAAQVVSADPVRSLAWEAGQLVFANEPLAAAVERVNRYSDQKLRIGDAAAGAVRINGVFTAGDTDAFVEGVTEVFPVREHDVNDELVFSSRR